MDDLSIKWQLSNIKTLDYSFFNENKLILAYSEFYKKDVVVKIGPKFVIDRERKALQYLQGDACVKLLDFDEKASALLLRYVKSGTTLKVFFDDDKDESATIIFADLIKILHQFPYQADDNNFETIDQWLRLLDDFKSQYIPQAMLLKASKLSHKLLQTQGTRYLLHGDLHHENILQRGDTWIAIDPKGVIGELEYEIGAFMRNPIDSLLGPDYELEFVTGVYTIECRLDKLSKLLNFDKQRLLDWSFVQAVLSACHAEQDGNSSLVYYFIKFARILDEDVRI